MDRLIDRARGALIGLAVGDALGQPTEGKTPRFIKERWGRITDFLSDAPVGSDDTEYAMFSARLLLEHGLEFSAEKVAAAWRRDIASQTGVYKGAGFSEMAAIENLRAGLNPPASGDHIHGWSDGLAMRVAPFGVAAAGNPSLAADLAERDGIVSHSGEGILSGKAVAAAVAEAMMGAELGQVVASALGQIPADSWTARAIEKGVEIGSQSRDIWEAVDKLHDALACTYYHWTDLGPEAVGLSFGVLAAARGGFREAVIGGVNVGRDTDTIAAIAGGIAGAMSGLSGIPQEWANREWTVRGICIHTVTGIRILDMADKLANFARKWGGEV